MATSSLTCLVEVMVTKKITFIERWVREQVARDLKGRPCEGREDETEVLRGGGLPHSWEGVELSTEKEGGGRVSEDGETTGVRKMFRTAR